MTRRLLVLLLLTTPAALGCHAPVTVVTPAGQTAYTADQIVVRVNELQNAALAANGSGGLSIATTRLVVQFAVDADKILAAMPAGWQTTVVALWGQAKGQIPAKDLTNPALAAAISAVDVVLAAYGGNGP